MSFPLQYSLGRNELDLYLRQSSKPSSSDSLHSIQCADELEYYFKKMKDQYLNRMHELERKLQHCINFYENIEKSLDLSRSRLKENRHSLDIERYEDLLECNFKQIEWTKSSRVQVYQQSDQKKRKISQIQSELQQFQQQIYQTDNQHQANIKDLQQNIREQAKQIQNNIFQRLAIIRQSTSQHLQSVNQFETYFQTSINSLEERINASDKNLLSILGNKIEVIESQLQSLVTQQKN